MNDAKDNLFPVLNYYGPAFFCDRENETAQLSSALNNGRNTVILAPRRFGKTGLIKHVFHKLKIEDKDCITVFVDIYSAKSMADFNSIFLNAVTEAIAPSKGVLETISMFFKTLRPNVSFDPFTGMPNVSLTNESSQKTESDLGEILKTLDAIGKKVFVAIDEFQQIEEFPENADAIMRTHVQSCQNINFIFSGSQKHLLFPIFSDAKRPFYASTDFLNLQKIDRDIYVKFIVAQFAKKQKQIAVEQAQFIVDWCRVHTYYVQVICNKLDAFNEQELDHQLIVDAMTDTIKEQDAVMSSIKAMLPVNQWQLFEAICLEDEISSYTSRDFIQKHRLASSAAIVNSLKALEQKEMIYLSGVDSETNKGVYEAYNVFFGKWVKHRKAISFS
jgi:uncharacterized protein